MAKKRNVKYTRKQCAKNYSDLRNKKMETKEITHMGTLLYTVRAGKHERCHVNKGIEKSASIQNSEVLIFLQRGPLERQNRRWGRKQTLIMQTRRAGLRIWSSDGLLCWWYCTFEMCNYSDSSIALTSSVTFTAETLSLVNCTVRQSSYINMYYEVLCLLIDKLTHWGASQNTIWVTKLGGKGCEGRVAWMDIWKMRTQYTELTEDPGVQGMGKRMETVVKHTHFYINTELDHHLPVI
jgi:hypothetical protein